MKKLGFALCAVGLLALALSQSVETISTSKTRLDRIRGTTRIEITFSPDGSLQGALCSISEMYVDTNTMSVLVSAPLKNVELDRAWFLSTSVRSNMLARIEGLADQAYAQSKGIK